MCFEALHSAMSNKMNENGITDCYYEVIPDHERTSQLNRELLKSINASGPVYMPSDVVEGIYIKGFAVGATLTEDRITGVHPIKYLPLTFLSPKRHTNNPFLLSFGTFCAKIRSKQLGVAGG
ncbi:hypothetical protein H0E87_031105 [Populus deltoides]|uniref:Uncharacterized protein n=1 Tax=Populus deltoides TaxID=3696 RepID=A0A8T2WIA5_POPDE|nr:hypothetical protein H0E87_031105 [Populus deltoides]